MPSSARFQEQLGQRFYNGLNSQPSSLISHSSSLSFCPSIFLSFAFARERSARFREQLGQRFYNGLNSPSYLSALPSFCHLLSLGIALRASRNSWDSGSTMGSTLRPIFLSFHLFVICFHSGSRCALPGTAGTAVLQWAQHSVLSFCPSIFLSFAFTRDRAARFQEQLGQRFYNGLNSQLSLLLPIFLPFHLFVICLHSGSRCALPGTAGTAVLQWAQLSTLTPPPYLSALPSFCHLLSLGIALRASRNSWDSGSTMGSTLNSHSSSLSFCPSIFLSFAFTRDRAARFQEQLGQRFYNGLGIGSGHRWRKWVRTWVARFSFNP